MAVDGAAHKYTFWDYQAGAWQKDHGIRIDHLLLSPQAADRLQGVEIFRKARSLEKASDHVPIVATFAEGTGARHSPLAPHDYAHRDHRTTPSPRDRGHFGYS
jgi:hypothetical protein